MFSSTGATKSNLSEQYLALRMESGLAYIPVDYFAIFVCYFRIKTGSKCN